MNGIDSVPDYVGAEGLRGDLLELMNGLEEAEELEWGRIVSLPADERAVEFERIGGEHGCRQVKDGETLLWLNDDERVEAMFCFVEEPTKAITEEEAGYWAWALYTSRQETVAKLQRESQGRSSRRWRAGRSARFLSE